MALQANVEYWFRLIYDCLRGACYGSVNTSQFLAWLAHLWIWVIWLGYILSILALIVIVYTLMRLFELRHREEEYYETLLPSPEETGKNNPRWKQIQELIGSTNPSDWRTAIVEADVMLDDALTRQGYTGAGVGEKLRQIEKGGLQTLKDAGEAHGVRNRIAHQGSAFGLTETLARRTIAQYENVFKELAII